MPQIPDLEAVKHIANAAAVNAPAVIDNEAALAGQPAGQYELSATSELVAWNGAVITGRGPTSVTPNALFSILGNTIADLRNKSAADGPQLAGGNRWLWVQTVPKLLLTDGGSVQPAKNGGYWLRENNTYKLPEWYGAISWHEGETPIDSGPQLQAWIDGAQLGQTLYTDQIFYTGQMLKINVDAVNIDWVGQLRPMPNYTGPLLQVDGNSVKEKQWGINPWQMSNRVWTINIDGLNQSQGVWFRNIDHFTIHACQVRRTNGFAVRFDACREGAAYGVIAMLCRQGPDKGVVEFLDTSAGADANNTLRIFDMHIIHNLGTHLYMDSPEGYKNGSICRLIDFFGLQVETISEQLDSVYTADVTLGAFDPHAVYDPTVDLVKIVTADSINFWGGHFFVARADTPSNGGITRGGAAIRLGFDAVTNGSANTATNIRFNGVSAFINVVNGSSIVALHHTNQIKLDIHPMEGLNNAPLTWKNSIASDVFVRTDKLWIQTVGAGAAFNAIGTSGQTASAAYVMQGGNGGIAKMFSYPSQIYQQPDESKGIYHVLDSNGRQWVQGAKGQLGFSGQEYLSLSLQSSDGTKKMRLFVGNDGALYVNDGTADKKVNLT